MHASDVRVAGIRMNMQMREIWSIQAWAPMIRDELVVVEPVIGALREREIHPLG
jgi:hypothetical protein